MISRWLQLVSCLIVALCLTPPSVAKKSEPTVSNPFKLPHEPLLMFYFEDTDTILMNLRNGDLMRSFDAGASWGTIEDEGMKNEVVSVHEHPYDKNKAYALGRDQRHWITTDQAKTWRAFEVPHSPHYAAGAMSPFSFHGWDSSKVIVETKECPMCSFKTYYTTDDFKSLKPLKESAAGCSWAVGHSHFGADVELPKYINDRTLCVLPGLKNPSSYAYRLVYSDDYFATEGTEVKLQDGRPVSGVTNVAAVKKFMVAAVEAQGTAERALYVTIDTETWHRAEFDGHRIEEDSYTILESTNYSLQIDVLTHRSSGMGTLFTSNSNGTYFTRNIDYTNRGPRGYVDFEKIANIQGIVLVNTVDNPDEVLSGSRKKVVTKISFDDGRTFESLKVDSETLHLHSVTAFANLGRVFSSPAPGLVMGVGNTGDYLKEYASGNLYVSDDAGLNWRLARKGPHKYEFGDQGAVLMAISDDGKAKKIEFSIDHGKEWKSVDLPHKLYPTTVTTTPDSTSLKFVLVGFSGEIGQEQYVVFSIDFAELHERKCEEGDFDKEWPARLDKDGNPDCLMGHKQFYRRRKANADCFVDEEFKDPVPDFRSCTCTAEDFECEYKPTEDGKSCVLPSSLRPPEGQCQDPSDTYMGPSGWRLIPGNKCIREGGESLDKNVEIPCRNVTDHPGAGKEIFSTPSSISAKKLPYYYYMERQTTNLGDDETILALNTDNQLLVSHDHGKSWKQELKDETIVAIAPHRYNSDMAYVLTNRAEGFWTIDRGQTFKPFKTKAPPSRDRLYPLGFHPTKRDWLLWIGAADCDTNDCHSDLYISKNRGEDWELVLRYVQKCEFESRASRPDSDYLLFCEQYEKENKKNRLQLVYSTDEQFSNWKVHYEDVAHYAARSEYIVVASRNTETGALRASISLDGLTFAEVKFPSNIDPYQNLYTVLDATTHAVFLYVEQGNGPGAEYGSLVKSNSNGTTFVLSLDRVNQNTRGYVDFERMASLEGVIVTNIVSNVEELPSGADKKIRTMITHNDGAQWSLLPPPAKDAEGKSFDCSTPNGKGTDQCALHLHGYTERRDERDTFSSGSAIGLMMGLGNVGPHLTREDAADIFMTRDGGITWISVKKGRWVYEYGDAGSIIVIAPESKPTKSLYYTTDEGDSWQEYEFSEVELEVLDISTVQSDTSKNFLLWCRKPGSEKELTTVNVDFSGLYATSCEFESDGRVGKDYELWEPKHPFQDDNCLFGHVEQYRRKKPTSKCWNNWRGPRLHSIGSNCTCSRQDYECDYNFEPQSDGSCALVPGLEKQDAAAYCKANPDAIEYWEKTGYRRIPQTTCQGGKNLDHLERKPCPGKHEEFDKKHGISGVGLFFAIVTPITVAVAVGYYAFTRWDGKFGQIRLGETQATSQGFLSRDSLLITVPIAIVAGIVAVAKTLPLLATSLWRSVSGYVHIGRNRGYSRPYSSRASFAARRGDYTSVVDDEDELLGVEEAEAEEDDEL
ncbi:hypothetical protein P175DRAFT_0448026 [Aspergillus ochraceoroseus IBT 24754]|uniref:Vacuolar protein sorting/targeting protein 10 n=2 Tax=Aspergillus subgen. Nidulantes TaxID=2720870 RepID=A0A0F8UTT7_9EURO|nr:uncharacterized protein P175DRAFT_0448026 [Aspergillus ochraceoroseus IBT 24754]KKK22888.1 hypothetical protein ARAM_005749 [Aspergillus rambellii]PTU23749.1 hypothetical protein P175DRAFT_0448026 [Aspergillus ochraceoroseus IBT 24754]